MFWSLKIFLFIIKLYFSLYSISPRILISEYISFSILLDILYLFILLKIIFNLELSISKSLIIFSKNIFDFFTSDKLGSIRVITLEELLNINLFLSISKFDEVSIIIKSNSSFIFTNNWLIFS